MGADGTNLAVSVVARLQIGKVAQGREGTPCLLSPGHVVNKMMMASSHTWNELNAHVYQGKCQLQFVGI